MFIDYPVVCIVRRAYGSIIQDMACGLGGMIDSWTAIQSVVKLSIQPRQVEPINISKRVVWPDNKS